MRESDKEAVKEILATQDVMSLPDDRFFGILLGIAASTAARMKMPRPQVMAIVDRAFRERP